MVFDCPGGHESIDGSHDSSVVAAGGPAAPAAKGQLLSGAFSSEELWHSFFLSDPGIMVSIVLSKQVAMTEYGC